MKTEDTVYRKNIFCVLSLTMDDLSFRGDRGRDKEHVASGGRKISRKITRTVSLEKGPRSTNQL